MKRKPYPKSTKQKTVSESVLWKWFSRYIRLRDSDENGYGSCFTCKRWIYWQDGDCGHGVGRQHWGTRYNEKNNHLQCKRCNGFEEGRKDLYQIEVNKRYGPDTWDILQASRNGKKYTGFEMYILSESFKSKAQELAKQKGIKI